MSVQGRTALEILQALHLQSLRLCVLNLTHEARVQRVPGVPARPSE